MLFVVIGCESVLGALSENVEVSRITVFANNTVRAENGHLLNNGAFVAISRDDFDLSAFPASTVAEFRQVSGKVIIEESRFNQLKAATFNGAPAIPNWVRSAQTYDVLGIKNVEICVAGYCSPDLAPDLALTWLLIGEWSSALVIASKKNDLVGGTEFFDDQTLYINISIQNNSRVKLPSGSYVSILVDGTEVGRVPIEALDAGARTAVKNFELGVLVTPTGTVGPTVRRIGVKLDPDNLFLEANEENNFVEKTVTITRRISPSRVWRWENLFSWIEEGLYFSITLTNNARLIFSTSGGQGDAEMYIGRNRKPIIDRTIENVDEFSVSVGNREFVAIPNAQPATYYVLLYAYRTFSGLTLSVEAFYSTNKPPVITSQPESVTVRRGKTAMFSVSATGTPPLFYQWQKGVLNISGATNSAFIISSVQTNDAGTYSVVVRNEEGTTTSDNAFLTVTVPQIGFPPANIADFNDDNESDIVFQDASGGLAVWFMKEAKLQTASLLTPASVSDAKYRIVGSGNFDGDEKPDLLFQHENGTLAVWNMDGIKYKSAALLNPSNPGDAKWRVVATGDFDFDNRTDLVLQHTDGSVAAWLLDGVKLAKASLLNPAKVPSGWRVVGAGDFNADGLTDLLLQHDHGHLLAWFLDGTTKTGESPLDPSLVAPPWRAVSVRDRNNDGQPDLLFQDANGSLALWFMEGTRAVKGVPVEPQNPGGTWKVVSP